MSIQKLHWLLLNFSSANAGILFRKVQTILSFVKNYKFYTSRIIFSQDLSELIFTLSGDSNKDEKFFQFVLFGEIVCFSNSVL